MHILTWKVILIDNYLYLDFPGHLDTHSNLSCKWFILFYINQQLLGNTTQSLYVPLYLYRNIYISSWIHINTKIFHWRRRLRKVGGKTWEPKDIRSFMFFLFFFFIYCSKFVSISHMSTSWVNCGLHHPPLEMKSRLYYRLELSSNIVWYMIHLDGKLLLYYIS